MFAARPAPLSLAGDWRFSLDRSDRGVAESWFNRALSDQIKLPGVLQAQGYGDPISKETPWVLSLYDRQWHQRVSYRHHANESEVKVPFLSQPPRHYLGVAWYQRDVIVPAEWAERRVVLALERPRWETTAWIDGRKVGSDHSLVSPHIHELGVLGPGPHTLTVRIDNRMILPYRPDAHGVSDSLGNTWNGIVGRIELEATSLVWLDDVQVFPDVERREARLTARIGNVTGRSGKGTVSAGSVETAVAWDESGGTAELVVPVGADARLWSEFDPALHRLEVRLSGDNADDTREVRFGLRQLRTAGTQFLLNGRPVHMRGTHHGGDFPLTGFPLTDVESWRKLFRTCRAWGLNHMRFHSWCPPEAAFVAADELGFYLQPECAMWNVINPGTEMEREMYVETERMLRAYGNHPSFLLMSPSNEPGGRWKESLPSWVAHFREVDPRRLYTTGTGWSLIDTPGPLNGAVDYLAVHRIGQNLMRGVPAWFGRDYSASMAGVDVPNLVHELGQWCAYPDFDVIRKFTGYLRPGNYEIFRDLAAEKGLLARNDDFARASGRFQFLCYKEEIEANLRTSALGGFQLLDLHDYLGQGTALVGLLDAFWEEKGSATAAEFARFCAPTVPLARLKKRVFTSGDPYSVAVELAHFGEQPIPDARPFWRVVDVAGEVVAAGEWPAREIPLGGGTSIGRVDLDLTTLAAPGAYRLVVGLRGQAVENDWKFWVYPQAPPPVETGRVVVTRSWPEAEKRLAEGARVLYLPRPAELDWDSPPLAAVPVFWNRLMGPAWSRMLGLWCDARHPALADFPTEEHCDWQWTEVIDKARAFNLDAFPPGFQPIVEGIDDWNRAYRLGVIFECRVGPGRLLVSCIDLEDDLERRPVARQLRRSLLEYMNGDTFDSGVAVEPATFRASFFETQVMARLGAVVEGPGEDLAALIDGDPNTFWIAGQLRPPRPDDRRGLAEAGTESGFPFQVTVAFPESVALTGVKLMPRQNHRDHQGDIREFTIETCGDDGTWSEVVRGELESSFESKEVFLPKTVTKARRLRLTALSGFGADATTSLAELAIITPRMQFDGSEAGAIEYQRVRSATDEIDEGGIRPTTPARPR